MSKEKNINSFWTKLSILLLNIFTVSSGATAATVPAMIKAFPQTAPTLVELTMTVSSLGIIFFTPLSNVIAEKIGVKKTILIGLTVLLISGVIPVFSNNFPLIFASRIGVGVGTGLLASYSQSLIISLYQGQEQQRLMGLSSVIQGLGMFLMTFSAGVLMGQGWHAAYWVNAMALPVLLLVAIFVPNILGKHEAGPAVQAEKPVNSKKVDGKIWLLAAFMFFFNSSFAFVTIKFASLVISKGYGTAQSASTLLGIMSFAMAAGGFIFMALPQAVKKFSLAISLGSGFLSYLILTMSNSLTLSGVGIVLSGIAVSMTMVSCMTNIGIFTSPAQVPFSTSVVMTTANIGQLLSPYIAQFLSKTFNNESPEFTFLCGTIVFAALLVVAILIGINFGNLKFKEVKEAK
ncbi:MFS transporter [Lactobacillus sp.]|uniref:MFS transporter n=1 Tax=Lactobacillus sp. TaxID=1591 RepID=UPI003EF6259C